jgi:hypothetical protein
MSLTETQMLVLSHAANREGGFLLPLPEGCRAKGGAVDKVVGGLIKRGWATTIKGRHLREVPANVEPWKTDEGGDPLYPLITRDGLRAIGVEPDGDTACSAEAPAEQAEEAEVPTTADTPATEAEPAHEEAEVAQEPTRRTSRAAGTARRRLATARNAMEAVCGHWAEAGRLDEALIQSCHATLAELQRADALLEAEAPAPRAGGEPRAGSKQAQMITMLRRPEGATIAQIADATGWQPHTVRGAIAGALKRKLGLNVTSEKPEGGGDRVYRVG